MTHKQGPALALREIGLGLTLGSSLGVIDEAESRTATLGLRFRF